MSTWDPGSVAKSSSKAKVLLRFIRIEHTFLSLPMAYSGAFVALLSTPPLPVLALIFSALFFLRVAGMTMDNIVDLDIDSINPRTKNRPLVTGALSLREAWSMIAIGLAAFFLSAYFINFWALLFSPVVAAVVISYPYVKKYTSLGAYHIALVEALSVFSGAIASKGILTKDITTLLFGIPWLLILSTLFWAVGFDLYNHIQDMDFDRSVGLKNLTMLLGQRVLKFAGLNQIASVILAFLADYFYRLGPISYVATVAHGLIMAYAYTSATRGNYGKAFNYNIVSSVVLGTGIVLDVLLGRPDFGL
ncbi:MAG: 4-hydroxybenzoate octaprenyltransferase [Nitrososphaerota archaeon]